MTQAAHINGVMQTTVVTQDTARKVWDVESQKCASNLRELTNFDMDSRRPCTSPAWRNERHSS